MLASKAHSRHPTWPPTVHLLPDSFLAKESTPRSLLNSKNSYTATLPEITEDEDPFSHFLSPVLDEESSFSSPLSDFDDSEPSYTAGITPYSSTSASKKDALFRARLEEKWETFVARRLLQHRSSTSISSAIPAPLPPPFPQQSVGPATPPNEDALPDLMDEAMDNDMPSPCSVGPSSPESMNWYFPSTIDNHSSDDDMDSDASDMDIDDAELDGWEADRRLMAEQRRVQFSSRRKFKTSRTGSGKKHAWREPSPDLWTVEEEAEELPIVDEEEGRGRRGRKRAKFVHWNEEVLVLEYER